MSNIKNGFRLGIYVCKDAEVVDFSSPYGVFSVARRIQPDLDVFLIAETLRPTQAASGFTVHPNYSFRDAPAVDAFLIPGGPGLRPEQYNGGLHSYIRSLPERCLLTSVCTGSWVYARMGLLDGRTATNRKNPDRLERKGIGKLPIEQLAEMAPTCRISRARIVDTGRIVTAGGIASGMELGFHLLRRAGMDEDTVAEVAQIMEYETGWAAYKDDVEYALTA
ncbi:DJ-1/PfpI family protein [Xanthobacter sp. KR7-225]|uniref:DJ-1/PfpI family protein n=1 Tax=Xanthobacter sp. KR7-225 TaxID=3156613 RepID=UPI0032B34B40